MLRSVLGVLLMGEVTSSEERACDRSAVPSTFVTRHRLAPSLKEQPVGPHHMLITAGNKVGNEVIIDCSPPLGAGRPWMPYAAGRPADQPQSASWQAKPAAKKTQRQFSGVYFEDRSLLIHR